MYLRKYPKDKNSQQDEYVNQQNIQNEDTEIKQTHKRCKTDINNEQVKNQYELKSHKMSNIITNNDSIFNKERRQQSRVKRREIIDTNENIQSDIFSGFMTVTINDHNKEIEVIRNSQDPTMHSQFKNTSSQFFIESKVRECQSKLKGKMVVLEQPINDFLVIGKNKLKSEKQALLQDQNKMFNKVIQIDASDDGIAKTRRQSDTQNLLQNPHQIQNKQQKTEVITRDYDVNELSKTGLYFFPRFLDKLNNASIIK